MNIQYKQVIACSAGRLSNKIKYYGKADVLQLSLINIIFKILDNPNMTLEFVCRRKLEELAAMIQICNPDICTVDPNQAEYNTEGNHPPTVDDDSTSYDDDYYTFDYSNFTNNFTDVDGDSPQTVRIVTLPVNGTLTYEGVPIEAGFEFNVEYSNMLEYSRDNIAESNDSFIFRISDDNINKLFSNMAQFDIIINQAVNQCPDGVGANSFTIDSAGTKIFTVADYTTGTTPPYSDPEGDAAEAIKITQLPVTGSLKLNGNIVTVNQVITMTSIGAGLFSYVADPSNTAGYAEIFYFSISDVGASCFTTGGQVSMTVNSYINQPAVIGDGERTVAEGVVITFNRPDFTSNTTPPYYDPEGDIADKLKIITLPATGDLKLNGINVIANDVINFSDIDAGNLTYEQDPGAGGTVPTFQFQIADAGSGTFVS